MRILFFLPFPIGSTTGNAVTLRRLARGLMERGCLVNLVDLPKETLPDFVERHIRQDRPDLVHFYHAYKTGRFLPHLREHPPAIITLSGTDLNQDAQDPQHRVQMEAAFERARVLIIFSRALQETAGRTFPHVRQKLRWVPKAVRLQETPFETERFFAAKPEDFVFFLPGGIRPVKNTLFAVEQGEKLVQEHPAVRLICAGQELDFDYAKRFADAIAQKLWVRHTMRIPHECMGAAYRRADVVLNTSLSEGLSNTLMEAMSTGRSVLASDIPANRELIEDGVTGLLYKEADDFLRQARRLIAEPGLRMDLGGKAARYATVHFSPEREIEGHLHVYRTVLGNR